MRSKYGNRKTEVDGFVFDSKREAERYSELKLLEKAGEIQELVLQPKFEVKVNGKHICNYYADFSYWTWDELTTPDPNNYTKDIVVAEKESHLQMKKVVEDVKGVRTDVFILKKKLVEALYNITIVEVR